MDNLLIIFNSEYSQSFFVYICIIFFTVGFAFISQNYSMEDLRYVKKFNTVAFVTSFLIAGTFIFLVKSGVDFAQYCKIYANSTFSSFSDLNIEPGYRLLNICMKVIIPNAEIGVSLIKLISLAIVFRSFYLLRDKIHVGIAILAYMVLFYFQSFDLIRIYLAGAILLHGYALFVIEGKYGRYFIDILLATSIHYTAIVALVMLVVEMLFRGTKRKQAKLSNKKIMLFAVLCIIGVFVFPYVAKFLCQKISVFNKYEKYFSGGSFGIGQFVYYVLPIFIAVLVKKYSNYKYRDEIFVLTIVGFCVALEGYFVGILTRMFIYFSTPFLITIPMFCNQLATNEMDIEYTKRKKINKDVWFMIIILYFIVRFILMAKSLVEMEGLGNIILIGV